MNDKELLKLAAKAAGVKCIFADGELWGRMGALQDEWNPLADDGDALRLAVQLGIGIHPDLQVDEVSTSFMVSSYGYNTNEKFGENPDALAATRRAIVRAAAEIGKTK